MIKTFLLGLGAQKAGTTWVYQYLHDHPECAMGRDKELSTLLEYFGNKTNTAWKLKRLEALEDVCKKTRWRLKTDQASSQEMQGLLERIEGFTATFDIDHYLNYFARRLAANPDAHLVGDITPEYCTFSAEELEKIKSFLEAEGYNVKVLFLMRDPVERCYSGLRMAYRRALKKQVDVARLPHEGFVESATAEWCQLRTRYENIVPRIEEVFAPENRHIAFFESLFSQQGIMDLCGFLGISYKEVNFEKRVNTSPRLAEPGAEAWAEVRLEYKDTYDYCAEKFGSKIISELWFS